MAISAQARLDLYHAAKKSGNVKESQKHFKALAKVADSRLRELEKVEKQAKMLKMAQAGDKKAKKWVELHHVSKNAAVFDGITNYAYKTALEKLKPFNTTRFDIKPKNALQERSLIAVAESFLLSTTSSKSAVIKSYKERVTKFNESWGTTLKWNELEDFVNSKEFQDLMSLKGAYDSKTVAYTYGKLQTVKDPEEIVNKIKSGADSTLFTDEPKDEIAKRLIKNGLMDKILRK